MLKHEAGLRIAYASAKEVDTHLRLLVGAGVVDLVRAQAALDLFDQVRAMTWRLLHPQGRAPDPRPRPGRRRTWRCLLALPLTPSLSSAAVPVTPAAAMRIAPPTFTATGPLSIPRRTHIATVSGRQP